MVVSEGWVFGEGFYEGVGGLGALGHRDGYGAVEFYDRGWGEAGEFSVEGDDSGPVGFVGGVCPGVAGG